MNIGKKNKLGTILLNRGLITQEQLDSALQRQKVSRNRLGVILIKMGYVTEADIVEAFSRQSDITRIDLSTAKPNAEALQIIPEELAKRYLTLPLAIENDELVVAMADPTDVSLKNAIEFATNKPIRPTVAPPTEIRKAIQRFYTGVERPRLGHILLQTHVISEEQLQKALHLQRTNGKSLGNILVDMAVVTEEDILRTYSVQMGFPYVDLSLIKVDQRALKLVSQPIAMKHLIFPYMFTDRVLLMAMADPLDINTINAIMVASSMIVKVTVSSPGKIEEAIRVHYQLLTHNKLGEISPPASTMPVKPPGQATSVKLINLFLNSNMITQSDLDIALAEQKNTRRNICSILLDLGMVRDRDIARTWALYYNVPYQNLTGVEIKPDALSCIPEKIALRHMILPLHVNKNTLHIAISNPQDTESIDTVKFLTGKDIRFSIATPSNIRIAINKHYYGLPFKRLGDILLESNLISHEDLTVCLKKQKEAKKKCRLGEAIIKEGLVAEDHVYKAFARQLNIDYSDILNESPSADVIKLIPEDVVIRYQIFPIKSDARTITVAMINPLCVETLNYIRKITGRNIHPTLTAPSSIKKALQKFYRYESPADPLQELTRMIELLEFKPAEEPQEDVSTDSDTAPIVRIVDAIIIQAINAGASDIHLEPGNDSTVIRNREDGTLKEVKRLPKEIHTSIVSRFKIIASLDIAERRMPQDGKIKFNYQDRKVELRVATLPTVYGESIVLRVLSYNKPLPLETLNMSARDLREFRGVLGKPYGLILVGGPTGSGKTTTLHAALGFINRPDKKIWTIEDPVEITQEGLNQVEVKPKIELDFARAMRAFLRADPDVIMVGEMRDYETASMGIKASLTGHLILSTLHTNSAAETVTRLIDIGLDPFNFADALLGVLAQRLVRTLCKACKQPYNPDEEEFDQLVQAYGRDAFSALEITYSQELTLYRAKGCEVCDRTGYKGRQGIFELLLATEPVKKLIQTKTPLEDIRQQALKDSMTTLMQDGILKVLNGSTDLAQVKTVCM
ncbi:type II secretory pathway, ATPase PulE/Tfp pilus assembly pathway, ATPase PilB [Candidatus Magnetobacterium bavaricum]|uniref:Type II secretory pathway, ATPase PulE/Tfp pilus assembly pathway, ATPase PilB n=1 Tax=Candidatus Magnetobacterium bavaricum TaxID=29290 RepID=A0A0F3GKH8_9BACT|nr:type II secretory pathway, ATPase PulE/Tfp pilus assembly pathway, ATPase PilB [Candidatus Magnetobacterium bavaricum]